MFERLKPLFQEDGIAWLKTQTVLVVGCGGVGSYAIEALVRSGIGTIVIVDDDTVHPSNLNRQLIAQLSTIGQKKVTVMAQRIHDIHSECHVHAFAKRYTPSNRALFLSPKPDFIFDAVDDIDAKVDLALTAHKNTIPFLSATGAGNRMHPDKLTIKPLKHTTIDPLARKLRMRLRETEAYHHSMCIVSLETPIKTRGTVASNSFVPPSAGLLGAAYIIQTLLEAKP